MSPDFISVEYLLQLMQEEIDEMVEDEGLILKSKFPIAIRVRLQRETVRALARKSGLVIN
jgi:hypothetical protein